MINHMWVTHMFETLYMAAYYENWCQRRATSIYIHIMSYNLLDIDDVMVINRS